MAIQIYKALSQRWIDIQSNLDDLQRDKIENLLLVEDEQQVRSNVELLLSIDDCYLCLLLKRQGNQIRLKPDIPQPAIYRRLIIEHVCTDGNDWFGLYKHNWFHQMLLFFFETTPYGDLSDLLQKEVIKKSMQCKRVKDGRFLMGASDQDTEALEYEGPQHTVWCSRTLSVGIYPVTQGLYQFVMNDTPSESVGATRPVEAVSWCDAIIFCNRLSILEGLKPAYLLPAGLEEACDKQHAYQDTLVNDYSMTVQWKRFLNGYRLLTEAEWEYCAHGGATHMYSGSNDADEVAWHLHNNDGEARGVGLKKKNGFGLYDMSGNIDEWVWDTWSVYAYNYERNIANPVYREKNILRVKRGGSWSDDAWSARVTARGRFVTSGRDSSIGFRVVRTIRH